MHKNEEHKQINKSKQTNKDKKTNKYQFKYHGILCRYIMFGRGICEEYQSKDEQFPELNGEGNLVSILVFYLLFVIFRT